MAAPARNGRCETDHRGSACWRTVADAKFSWDSPAKAFNAPVRQPWGIGPRAPRRQPFAGMIGFTTSGEEALMKTLRLCTLLAATALAPTAYALDDLTRDAAIGGALGGALGGIVGAELGGRSGAIIGAGVGGAAGTAIATDDDSDGRYRHDDDYREVGHYHKKHHHRHWRGHRHEHDDDDD